MGLIYIDWMVLSGILHYSVTYNILFYMPKVYPFFIVGLYFILPNSEKLNFTYKLIVTATLGVAIVVTIFSAFVDWNTLTFALTNEYNWSVSGWLSWNYCFIIAFILADHHLKDTKFAFTYAALSLSVGGLIYELPVCFRNSQAYYDVTFPLLINTQWISLAFVVFMFYRMGWRLNKITMCALIIYVAGAVGYIVWANAYYYNIFLEWIPRAPTIALLCLLPYGLKRREPQ